MGNTQTVLSSCANGSVEQTLSLINQASAQDIETQDDFGRTPLLAACCRKTDPDQYGADRILQALVAKEAKLDHQDEQGWTALHYCCHLQRYILVDCLLSLGAVPIRDNFGLLPQDFLFRASMHNPEDPGMKRYTELQKLFSQSDPFPGYAITAYGLRASGVLPLNMGDVLVAGSIITVKFDVPEDHSAKDFIQLLYYEDDHTAINFGEIERVPADQSTGQVTFKTEELPVPCVCRFIYVKNDINGISRNVAATGCNISIDYSIQEHLEYNIYVLDRVLEIESIHFASQSSRIALKRIGIEDKGTNTTDWVSVKEENYIVAVNDISTADKSFDECVELLQSSGDNIATKITIRNTVIKGDFIPEKVLGIGVIGKYATLYPTSQAPAAQTNGTGSTEQSSDECASRQVNADSWDEDNFEDAVEYAEDFGTVLTRHEVAHGMELVEALSRGITISSPAVPQ